MLVELTIEANEEYFVIVLQHGGNDVMQTTIRVLKVPEGGFSQS